MEPRGCLRLVALFVAASGALAGEGWIDTHVHLKPDPGRSKGGESPFIACADQLIAKMDANGVETAIVLPPPRGSEGQKAYQEEGLSLIIRRYKGRLLFVGGGTNLCMRIHQTDPGHVTKEVRAEFEREAEGLVKLGTRAFGEIAALHFSFKSDHPFEESPPDHPLFLLLSDLAARHDVPIDLHIEIVPEEMDTPAWLLKASALNPKRVKANLEGLEKLLSHNAKTRVVWQHVGWDNTGKQTPDLVRGLLDRHPNLYASVHGVGEGFSGRLGRPSDTMLTDGEGKLRPEWRKLIEDHSDRFMIGSDQFFGPSGYAERMPEGYDLTWKVLSQLPADLARKVGRENAARIYRLK